MKNVYFHVFTLFFLGCILSFKTSAQVTVTAPSLTVSGCSFPTNYFALGNIVIRENLNNDFSTSGTLILTAPANFEFLAGTGSAVFFTGTSRNVVNATSITSTSIYL